MNDSEAIAERLDVMRQRATEEAAPWLPPRFDVSDADPLSVKVEKALKFLQDLDRAMREGPRNHAQGDEEEASFVALAQALKDETALRVAVGQGLTMKQTENTLTLSIAQERPAKPPTVKYARCVQAYANDGSVWGADRTLPEFGSFHECDPDGTNASSDTIYLKFAVFPDTSTVGMLGLAVGQNGTIVNWIQGDYLEEFLVGQTPIHIDGYVVGGFPIGNQLPIMGGNVGGLPCMLWTSASEPDAVLGYTSGWKLTGTTVITSGGVVNLIYWNG
jgi:hypothetical protein